MKKALIALTLFLLGCSETAITSSQSLPISAQMEIKGQTIELEVAKTEKEKAIGLMHRNSLPKNKGMLFDYSKKPSEDISFWMKNCRISLDIIFLENETVKAITTAPPCKQDPCPKYSAKVPVNRVIELNGGRANEIGIKIGDQIKISDIN